MGERVVVQLDVFPARVTLASTTYSNVRAVIHDGTLELYSLTAGGIRSLYAKPSLSVDGSIGTGVSVETADGIVWVEQDGGCGCGSQLRGADLFPGQQRVMIPLRS